MIKSKIKLLLVDDEIDLCDLLAFQFEDEGFEVKTSYSFHAAVSSLDNFTPDIILSDMQMPGGTGLDLHEKWRKKGAVEGGRFYIMTGFASATVEEILAVGVTGVLTKPMPFSDILKAIGTT